MALNTYAVDLQGSTQYIDFTDVATLDGLATCTIEFWLRADALPASGSIYFFQKWQGGVNQNMFIHRLQKVGGDLKHYIFLADSLSDGGNNYGIFPQAPSVDTYYHFAMVYDGGGADNAAKLKLLIDASPITADSFGGTIPTTLTSGGTVSLRFGNHTGDPSPDGKIDELRIWNTARTEQQISDNKGIQLVGNESGLIHYWKCNDGTGTTVTATTGSANGTITNGTETWSTTVPFPGTSDGGYLSPSNVW